MGIVVRQSVKSLIINYAGALLGLLGMFYLFPKILTPEEFGAYRLIIELTTVLSGFALFGAHYSSNKYYPYFVNPANNDNGFLGLIFGICSIGLILVLTAVLVFQKDLLGLFNGAAYSLDNSLVLILCLFLLFNVLILLANSLSANYGRIAKPYLAKEVGLRILILLALVLYALLDLSFIQFLIMAAASYGLVFLIDLYFINSERKISFKLNVGFLKENRALIKDMSRYSGFLFFSSLSGLIIGKLDIIMVSKIMDLSWTAIYSLAFYLALFLEMPKRGLLQMLTPISAKFIKENNSLELQQTYKKSSDTLLLAGLILFFLIWTNLDFLFDIMPKGEIYKQGKLVVLILGLTKIFELSLGSSNIILSVSKYYPYAVVNLVFGTLIAILGNYYLIPLFGINGAAFATCGTVIFTHSVVLLIVYFKMGIIPYSINTVKIILTLVPFFLVISFFDFSSDLFGDSVLKTVILLPTLAYIIYKFRFSIEFNQTLERLISKIIKYFLIFLNYIAPI